MSYTVLEHIPPDVIVDILREGRRVLRPSGLFVHLVDPSDHFAHADKRISSGNFLRFSASQWERYAGSRYMYHNRLRVNDISRLFDQAGAAIIHRDGRVDPRFAQNEPSVNATLNVRVVAAP